VLTRCGQCACVQAAKDAAQEGGAKPGEDVNAATIADYDDNGLAAALMRVEDKEILATQGGNQ
jgi:hypothetical protein